MRSSMLAALLVSGFAPYQNILGSYFPAWLLCAMAGLALALITQRLFAISGLEQYLIAPVFVYAVLSVAYSFSVWIACLD